MLTRHPSDEPAALTLAAFTAVVDRQQNALHTFLQHLVDDAEQAYDLLQDTLHDAWRAAGSSASLITRGLVSCAAVEARAHLATCASCQAERAVMPRVCAARTMFAPLPSRRRGCR